MRYSLQGTVRDENGIVVGSAQVSIFNVRTTTIATIYSSWSGGTAVTSAAVFANSGGRWQCYVDDSDYPFLSEFDVVFTKAGFSTQSYTAVR